MKIRAAVLEEFGQPLVVQEVELAEPEGRRGARPARRVRRLPHRPLHGLGRRPDRLRAVRARARGRRRGRGGRRGRDARRAGRPRDHAVRARVREVHPLPEPADEPLRRDPRPAGPRLPARRHDPALPRRRAAAALHGHVDVRRVHGDARDRARKGEPGGARSTAARRSPAGSRPGSAPRCTRPRSSRARPWPSSAAASSASAP